MQPCSCIIYQMVTRRRVCVLGGCGPWWRCVPSAGTAGGGCAQRQGVRCQWCAVLLPPVICGYGQNNSPTRPWYISSAGSRLCACRCLWECWPPRQTSSRNQATLLMTVSSVMCTPKNLKLLTLSRSASPMWMGRCTTVLSPVVQNHLFSFTDVERQWF